LSKDSDFLVFGPAGPVLTSDDVADVLERAELEGFSELAGG